MMNYFKKLFTSAPSEQPVKNIEPEKPIDSAYFWVDENNSIRMVFSCANPASFAAMYMSLLDGSAPGLYAQDILSSLDEKERLVFTNVIMHLANTIIQAREENLPAVLPSEVFNDNRKND